MLSISAPLIVDTVNLLKASAHAERVVLWLASRSNTGLVVREVFLPVQIASADFFRIPPEAMRALFARLTMSRRLVAAQVHTHPADAFHSFADDNWAIVRHVGALSLVVPRFCQDTIPSTFVDDTKVFALDSHGRFVETASHLAYRVISS